MIGMLSQILAQISVDGLEQAAQQSVLNGVLVSIILVLFGVLVYIFKLFLDKNNEIKKINDDRTKDLIDSEVKHQNKIDTLSRKFSTDVEDIRKNSQQKEDDRHEKSLISEREMMNVLNGVNSVMNLGDRMRQKDNKQHLDKLT